MHVGRVCEAKGRTWRGPTWRGKAEDGGRATKEIWGDPGKSDIIEPMGEKANFKKGTVITVITAVIQEDQSIDMIMKREGTGKWQVQGLEFE